MPLCVTNTSALGNYQVVADVGHLPTGTARFAGLIVYQTDTAQTKLWDGVGWVILSEPSQTWTPAFAGGVTAGNGVWTQNYFHRSDGFCDFSGVFTLGSTSSVSGFLFVAPPVAALFMETRGYEVEFGDASAGAFFRGVPGVGATTAAPLWALALNPVYVAVAATGPTVPFTWAVSDTIKISGRYRMATRYL